MGASRIPEYDHTNPDGMLVWFAEMAQRDLLFHPEDSARDIISVVDEKPVFTKEESVVVDRLLAEMFAEHGERVLEVCYPVFMRKAGCFQALDK